MARGYDAEEQALILVVEDDEELRTLLAFNLERHGYRVAQAEDGVAGLELARELGPDLVILDLMLPKLDGRQVCRQLRAESDTPVMMLTALDKEIDVVNGLDAGADDYVTKPFALRELLARVKALLRRTPWRPTASATMCSSPATWPSSSKSIAPSSPAASCTCRSRSSAS